MVNYELKPDTKLTDEQKKMLMDAEERPVEFTDDTPELKNIELAHFYRVKKSGENG